MPPEDARTVFDELVEQGAIHNTLSMNGTPEGDFDFALTSTGGVLARNARDTYRHELALRRVLEWRSGSGLLQREDFSGRLSDQELRDADHYLVDRGLCEGHKNGNGEFFHVEITPSGRATARQPYLIDQGAAPSGPVTNVSNDNYGTLTVGNQVIGGQGHTVTANVTQGASLEDVLKAVDQLRSDVEAAPGIDDDDRNELLEEIDALTAKAPRRGLDWLKAALVALGAQLVPVVGQELANQALEIGSSII
ncbi:hypothetical protein ACW9HR_35190 [Nocardia gipuzkoensis]